MRLQKLLPAPPASVKTTKITNIICSTFAISFYINEGYSGKNTLMQYTGIIYFTMSTMEIARLALHVTFIGNCKGAPGEL